MRRFLLVWALLFAAYCATLGVDSTDGAALSADETAHLRVAEALVDDGRLLAEEPVGIGFGALIAPAEALGGETLVGVLMAAIAALAFALCVPLARRVVPDPWATSAVVVVGLSPPALAYSTTIVPEMAAAALLAGAVLLALRVRDRSRLPDAYLAATLLALLPWLGTRFLAPAAVAAVLLVRWTARRGRGLGALVSAEIVLGSVVVFASVNEALYGGMTPHAILPAGVSATGAEFPGHLERTPRLVSLWLDRDFGLLRWAPVLALAFVGVFALWRSLADRVARAIPERRDAEAAAAAVTLVCGSVLAVAAFAAPEPEGDPFPGRHLVAALPLAAVLCAWGLRRVPRAGRVLAGLTLLASAWLAVDLARGAAGSWEVDGSDAPLGPLLALIPRMPDGSATAVTAASVAAIALLALAVAEWRRIAARSPHRAP